MTDGEAMLRSILAGKGNAHALADWIVEQVPNVPETPPSATTGFRPAPHSIVSISQRRLSAFIRAVFRNEFGVWLRMGMDWGEDRRRYSPLIWLDPSRMESVAVVVEEIQKTFQFRGAA